MPTRTLRITTRNGSKVLRLGILPVTRIHQLLASLHCPSEVITRISPTY